MVVLITGNGQYPSTHGLAMNSFGFPWAIRLLRRRLVLGSHAPVRPAASVANKIASHYVVSRYVGTAYLASMGSSLDDFVTLLFHAVAQLLEQLFIAIVDARMGHRDGFEYAKHGDLTTRSTRLDENDVWI